MTDWQPHVTVASIIKIDDRFLLVKEKTSLGVVYNQPAGHLEKNETLVEAVIRETLEETGQIFTPEYLVGIYNWAHPSGKKNYVRFSFFGTIQHNPNATPIDPAIISTHLMTYDELVRTNALRSPQVLKSLDDYLSGKQYPLSILNNV